LFQKQYGENLRVEIFTFMSGQTFNIQSPPNAHSRCFFSSIFVIKKFGNFFFPKKKAKLVKFNNRKESYQNHYCLCCAIGIAQLIWLD
jgi:hypothetical protein